jgi:transcription elongation factor Elf1
MEVPTSVGNPLHLARHDTSSSTGSAKPIPEGNWMLNLSGNCPACHHHHASVKVEIKAKGDSNQIGDVHCEHCDRLWLDSVKRSSTRISLMSTETIEIPEQETVYRSALVQIIRSALNLAASSPSLPDIPEANSPGLSHDAPDCSGTLHAEKDNAPGIGRHDRPESANIVDNATSSRVEQVSPPVRSSRNTMLTHRQSSRAFRVVARVRQKFVRTFPASRNHRLGRWVLGRTDLSMTNVINQNLGAPSPRPSSGIAPVAVDDEVGSRTQADLIDNPMSEMPVDTSTPSNVVPLQTFMSMDEGELEALSLDQRIALIRRKWTAFKSLSTDGSALTERPRMVDGTTQVDMNPSPRRHSALAYVGYWEIHRGSTSTLNRRPLSMSETHLSDVDTIVEGRSISSVPHHLFRESLLPTNQRSGSPRPLSVQSLPYGRQHVFDIWAESRRSFDSAATGRIRMHVVGVVSWCQLCGLL